jgi:hypothetical protein
MLTLLLPYLIVLVLAWPLVTLLHELSHYVMVKYLGYQVVEFKPWPHLHEGIFYLGRVAYTSSDVSEEQWLRNQILISSAPLWTSYVLAAIWFGIASFTWLPLAGIAIAHTFDASWWWIHLATGDKACDGRKWWDAWRQLRKL